MVDIQTQLIMLRIQMLLIRDVYLSYFECKRECKYYKKMYLKILKQILFIVKD